MAQDVVRSGLAGVVQELSRQVAVGLVVGREALGKELAGDAVQDARDGLLVWVKGGVRGREGRSEENLVRQCVRMSRARGEVEVSE